MLDRFKAKSESAKFLGHTCTDLITGFSGTVTGYCEYLTGCNQALVVAKSTDGKPAESVWFDVQRLQISSNSHPVVLDNSSTPGCDKPAPKR